MPVKQGKDAEGSFFRYGKSGKKYYFDPDSEQSKKLAMKKAKKQETAIYASGYRDEEEIKKIKIIRKREADFEDDEENTLFLKNVVKLKHF